MNYKVLRQRGIAFEGYDRLNAVNAVLILKQRVFDTVFLPYFIGKVAVNKAVLIILLFIPFYLSAQSGLSNTVQSRVNDPAVTVTVDNPTAQQGETVTITILGVPVGKKAVVKAGNAFDDSSLSVTTVTESEAYSFTMPDYPVYIDVDIQPISANPTTYTLTLETPGVSSGDVTIQLEGQNGGDVEFDAASGYLVKTGAKITATLQTPLSSSITLLSIRGYAPGGDWQATPLVPADGAIPMAISFTMPAADIVLQFTFHKQSAPDPGPGPGPSPEPEPDPKPEPDPAPEPDPDPDVPPVANEVAPVAGISLHASGGVLLIRSDRAEIAHIYRFDGALVRSLRLSAGEQTVSLPRRPYIVRVGNECFKIGL